MRPLSARATAVVVSAVVLMGGTAVTAVPAYADDHGGAPPRPPNPEAPQAPQRPEGTDIQGQEPFDTDVAMGEICEPGAGERVSGAINTSTGEFMTKREYRRETGSFQPRGDWETFRGNCSFPEVETWDHDGTTKRVSGKYRNLGKGDDEISILLAHLTSRSATTSFGTSVSTTKADEIFSETRGSSHDHTWAWTDTRYIEETRTAEIPACTEVWLEATPRKRTVRVKPVLEVEEHRFVQENGRGTVTDSWRGRGEDHKRVFSDGFHIDGTADVLLPDGRPDLTLDRRERKLPKKLCD